MVSFMTSALLGFEIGQNWRHCLFEEVNRIWEIKVRRIRIREQNTKSKKRKQRIRNKKNNNYDLNPTSMAIAPGEEGILYNNAE